MIASVDRRVAGGGSSSGTLIIIGGGEDRTGGRLILREVARRAGSGKIVVATLASEVADELWADYADAFGAIGVENLAHLDIGERGDAFDEDHLRVLDGASTVFFTGGAQLKITSKVGGTAIFDLIHQIYQAGGTIAGTSAGASVMSDTMLVSGMGAESHKVGGMLLMAPGLGLVRDVIVDQHFAQRGRIGRLAGAVAQNPRVLGVGIDEDTAMIVEGGDRFCVMGSGAVYILDGRDVFHSNITEEEADRTMSIFGLRLHILSQGDRFDLRTHVPECLPDEAENAEPAQIHAPSIPDAAPPSTIDAKHGESNGSVLGRGD